MSTTASTAKTAAAAQGVAGLRRVTLELFRREPMFAGGALLLLALIPPTLLAMVIDDRTLLGENVWDKPLKFQVSLVLYLGALAWFAGWLTDSFRASRLYRAFAVIVVLCVMLEMAWIMGAAAFGVRSHFNLETPEMAAIYGLMGVLAVTLTSATLVYGAAILRNRNAGLSAPFRWSVGLGLILTFFLTVIVAGYLAQGEGHLVGATPDGDAWPIVGWSREGGDLRAPHFFATHAMHFLPLLGLMVAGARHGRAAVWVGAALYVGFVGYVFAEAIDGRPFLSGLL